MSLEEDLRKSKDQIGPIYPVILDADGNVIDGFHRLKADPNWPTLKLDWVKDEKTREIVRLHVNQYRRSFTQAERREACRKLAEHIRSHGVKRGDIVGEVSRVTGLTPQYVRELLPDEFKATKMARKVEPPLEPIYVGCDFVCDICGAVYRLFHIKEDKHEMEMVKEGVQSSAGSQARA
jgi:hypothetical protein